MRAGRPPKLPAPNLFKHDFRFNQRRFVTMIVDNKNKRLMEVVEGKARDSASLRL